MEIVNGTYESGHVELGQPVDWPEGTKVDVKKRETKVGMSEDEWPRNPESIEKLIRRWEAIEPLVFTQEELADFEAARKRMGRLATDKLDRTLGAD